MPPSRNPTSGSAAPPLCRLSVIVLQQPAQSLLASHDPPTGGVLGICPRKQQLIVFALMISLSLIMFAEVPKGAAQGGFTEQDQLGKTLALDRANPTFRVTVQIGAAGRQGHAVDPAGREGLAEIRAELRVAIVQHVAAPFQIAHILQRRVASHLLHPVRVRMSSDPGESYAPRLQLNEEQDVVRHQASPAQHLHREEIGSSEHVSICRRMKSFQVVV